MAIEGFQYLTRETSAAVAGITDPVEALAALARAYVTSAVGHQGHAAIMFRDDAVDTGDADYQEWGQRAYGVLLDTVERLARAESPDLDVEPPPPCAGRRSRASSPSTPPCRRWPTTTGSGPSRPSASWPSS